VHSEYVEQRNGGYYVAGTRVSLDSIVYSFKAGDSPETIRQNFSSLTLEQVYGAIAFYLAHEQQVDTNIREGEEELCRSVPPLSEASSEKSVGYRYAPVAPEARLTRPANPSWDSAASAFPVRSPLPFELSLPSLVNATPLAKADSVKRAQPRIRVSQPDSQTRSAMVNP
jgi:uncharacterized protein (DUF433 family)